MGSAASKSKSDSAASASPGKPVPPDDAAEKNGVTAIPAPPEATIPPVDVTIEAEPGTATAEEATEQAAEESAAPAVEESAAPAVEESAAPAATESAAPAQSAIPTDAATKPPYTVVFVLGGPGSGKGTNCARIKSTFGYEHLSAGDLLRAERQSGSQLADMINQYIVEGKIVPAQVTVDLLRKAMDQAFESPAKTDKFLVDGFPRDLDNLHCWESEMDQKNITIVDFLLFLDCPNDVVVERLLERGKTSGRSDDNPETIKKRLETYEQQTRPIIDHFASLGKARTVDSNRSQEEVFADVARHFTK